MRPGSRVQVSLSSKGVAGGVEVDAYRGQSGSCCGCTGGAGAGERVEDAAGSHGVVAAVGPSAALAAGEGELAKVAAKGGFRLGGQAPYGWAVAAGLEAEGLAGVGDAAGLDGGDVFGGEAGVGGELEGAAGLGA